MKTRIIKIENTLNNVVTYEPQKRFLFIWFNVGRGRIFYDLESAERFIDFVCKQKTYSVIKDS